MNKHSGSIRMQIERKKREKFPRWEIKLAVGNENENENLKTRKKGKVKKKQQKKSCQVSFVIIIFYMAFRMFQLRFSFHHPKPPTKEVRKKKKLELNSEIGINLLGSNFSIFTFLFFPVDVEKQKRKRAENSARKGNWIKGQVRGRCLEMVLRFSNGGEFRPYWHEIICCSHLFFFLRKLRSVDLMVAFLPWKELLWSEETIHWCFSYFGLFISRPICSVI